MRILFWDLETAPTEAYIWKLWKENIGVNQIIEPGRVLCWSAGWRGEDEIEYGSEWGDGEEKMIRRLHALLSEADVNVTYNGNHFDIPTINSAFLKLGLSPPAPSKSVDLYQVVKKRFRLLSNRMDYVAKHVGLEGKIDTGGFKLWSDVLRGDKGAQEAMLEYNIQDVVVLENLYDKLLPWIPNHPQQGHFSEGGHVCPTCGSGNVQRRGMHRTKVLSYQRYQCIDCGSWSRDRIRDPDAPVNNLVGV